MISGGDSHHPQGDPGTDRMEAARAAVRECTRCSLCDTRTNAVPGIGSGESGVMFVGEAPGRSEDLRGRPFVGRAGKVLTRVLEEAGISRESVYITNTVKCRPPQNRVPNQSERDACRAHLDAEISMIKPDIICIMGNTAYGSILGGAGKTDKRGSVVRKDGMFYFLTVHPAAVIYTPDLAGVLATDIKRLFEVQREIRAGREVACDGTA